MGKWIDQNERGQQRLRGETLIGNIKEERRARGELAERTKERNKVAV